METSIKMTGRVDILGCICEKLQKKLEMRSQEQKNFFLVYLSDNVKKKNTILGPVTLILTFFAIFV